MLAAMAEANLEEAIQEEEEEEVRFTTTCSCTKFDPFPARSALRAVPAR